MFVLKMDLKFFVKVILVIPKKGESFKVVFFNKLVQKWVELLRESVRNDGKGL